MRRIIDTKMKEVVVDSVLLIAIITIDPITRRGIALVAEITKNGLQYIIVTIIHDMVKVIILLPVCAKMLSQIDIGMIASIFTAFVQNREAIRWMITPLVDIIKTNKIIGRKVVV